MTRVRTQIVITPPTRLSLPKPRAMWEAREVFVRFGMRDVTLRYRQTALGVGWVVLQPVLSAGILTIIFGKVANLPTNGVPTYLFAFSGMLVWNVFAGIIGRGGGSLVQNAGLISKVFFPRVLVPLSVIYSTMLDFIVAFLFMGVLLGVYGIDPTWRIVTLPIWILLACLLGSGAALIISPLMVYFRDVAYVVPFALSLLQYASPLAYSVPSKYRVFFEINPITWLLEGTRWSLLRQSAPPTLHLVGAVAVPCIVFLAGAMFFEQKERTMIDVI